MAASAPVTARAACPLCALACSWAEIDYVICSTHDIRVVFNDDNGVT